MSDPTKKLTFASWWDKTGSVIEPYVDMNSAVGHAERVGEVAWTACRTEYLWRIKKLEKRLKQVSTFNPDWDKLDAAEESLREHMSLLKNAQARIEELEAVIKRLGSMEAFDIARGVNKATDGELSARIDYARKALSDK